MCHSARECQGGAGSNWIWVRNRSSQILLPLSFGCNLAQITHIAESAFAAASCKPAHKSFAMFAEYRFVAHDSLAFHLFQLFTLRCQSLHALSFRTEILCFLSQGYALNLRAFCCSC